MATRTRNGLTVEHEMFARLCASGISQTDAYMTVFEGARNWKAKSVWENASKLAARTAVRERISELLEAGAAAAEVDAAMVQRDLVRRGQLAELKGDYGTAIRSSELLGRIVGSFEKDNAQRNPLGEWVKSLAGNVFQPRPEAALPDEDDDEGEAG